MHLDFMKPDIWDGLVLGTVFIGLALAALRIMDDLRVYQRKRDQEHRQTASFLEKYSEEKKNNTDTR